MTKSTKSTKSTKTNTNKIGFAKGFGEPDPAFAEVRLAAQAARDARSEARLAERPNFIPASRRPWDELSEEALAEVNLANRALNAARRIAGGTLAVRRYAHEHGSEAFAEASEQQWLTDEQAWLSAEEVLQEILVKHGMMEEGMICAPSLMEFAPGAQKPSGFIDTDTREVLLAHK